MAKLTTSIPELTLLSKLIEQKPESFATGDSEISSVALDTAKFAFDLAVRAESESKSHINGLLLSLTLSDAPQTRSRSHADVESHKSSSPLTSGFTSGFTFGDTPLSTLFVDGMEEDQIWAQLDLRAKSICDVLQVALEGEAEEDESGNEDMDEAAEQRYLEALRALENGEEIDLEDLQGGMGDEEDDTDDGDGFLDESDSEGEHVDEEQQEEKDEKVVDLRNSSDEESDKDEPPSLFDAIAKKSNRSKRSGTDAHTELDDGFFNLTAFNAETEQAEARSSSRGYLGGDDEDDDDDNMSVDLFAPVDPAPEFDEEDLERDPSEALYKDFFEPPPRAPKQNISPRRAGRVRFHEEVRVRKIKANGKNLPLNTLDDGGDGEKISVEVDRSKANELLSEQLLPDRVLEASESDVEDSGLEDENGRETIGRLKDDLFASEDQAQDQDLSTHEKRLAALREQIAELEAENVGKKDWVLMGEAGSRTRPQNSLLEEDLEFERVMKAVPVVTEEAVQNLEERIKARILDGRFDDVIRIRPMDDKPFLPSRFFELKDTKSSQSLAQIYEDEYVEETTGAVADDRDGRLKKEHTEIENLWQGICGKLDALCNAHFTPKQPKTTISTIANISGTSLESALPTTHSVETMLAPEEVFAPLTTEPRARSELTPTEKQALRNKERKSKKKSRDMLDKSVDKYAKMKGGSVRKQKKAALESVVKHGRGITVVGKPSASLTKKGRKGKK